ncbi:hypothetical protein JYB62_01970 [Algoriphagus lutimaris]|uniref:DUF6044 family protein n=1 Tax=Algoriphagus lutimaris TaxID=613197 RepID=UPI00196AC841|nr:DUF6044 family protein [Algoriphagus lutimaris]MBN3518755.1 hypothetical protein [Algoriphagus lutimaris]
MNKTIIFLVLLVLVMLLPYFILGEGVFIPVSDNMDSNLAWYKMLQDQGKIFSSWNTPVEGMLIETPRFSYPSGFNVEMMLYGLFPHLNAYMINKALIIIIAFFSFRFWLRGQQLTVKNGREEILWCLLWASLAYYPHRGISIAALPALVQVFSLLLGKKDHVGHWLFLIGYACYSMLFLASFYFLTGILGWIIVSSLKNQVIPTRTILAFILLMVVYSIQEINWILGYFLNDQFESHRADFTYDFGIWINQSPIDFFWSGDQNGVHFTPIYPIIFFGLVMMAWYQKKWSSKSFLFLNLLFGVSFILAILSRVGNLEFWGKVTPKLNSINLYRFEYWIPFFLFAGLVYAWKTFSFRGISWILSILIFINLFVYQYEWRYWINSMIPIMDQQVPSYQSYNATNQMEEIKEYLGEELPNSHFVNFNIPPAVAAFNGLITADGYVQLYSKSHKEQVYQLIKEELGKDDSLEQHFLEWGNKCYFQNAQYPDDYFMYQWRKEAPLMEPSYDYESMKNELGINYVLSALPVISEQLQLVKVFEDEHSAWSIHLYQLK